MTTEERLDIMTNKENYINYQIPVIKTDWYIVRIDQSTHEMNLMQHRTEEDCDTTLNLWEKNALDAYGEGTTVERFSNCVRIITPVGKVIDYFKGNNNGTVMYYGYKAEEEAV